MVNLTTTLDFMMESERGNDFDNMLDSAKVKELQSLIDEKKYLIDQ